MTSFLQAMSIPTFWKFTSKNASKLAFFRCEFSKCWYRLNTTTLLLHSCFHVLSYISIYVFSTLSFFLYYYNSYSPPSLSLTISTTLSFFYTESGTLFTVFGPRSMHVYNVCCNSIGLALVLDSYNITKREGVLYSFINIKTFTFFLDF